MLHLLYKDDCPVSAKEIINAIKAEPIPGLDILMQVKDGTITQLLP